MPLPFRLLRGCRRPVEPRRLTLEALERRELLYAGVTPVDDAFQLRQNGPQTTLDVLANDLFADDYDGAGQITSVSFGSDGGRIEIGGDGQHVLYTPPADFYGVETFAYAIDGHSTGQVSVAIDAPLEFDHYEIPPDGLMRQLNVLANDPFWSDYAGPRQITSVSVGSAGGLVAIGDDGQSIDYTPPDGAFGRETFIYIVDEIYPSQVVIEIPVALRSDEYEFVQHEPPATLRVLSNDPLWPNYSGDRQITHVTESRLGAGIDISADGQSLIYQQPETFELGSYDSFRYVVDGQYEAYVSVVLHRPVRNDYFTVDQDSTDFYVDLVSNDTYRDRNQVTRDVIDRITAVTQPESGGSVSIAADGHGVFYTPPAGFTGNDSFTYLADGVHEATVTAYVSRSVRDDYLSTGIYQDTPGSVVRVLENDFLGNGYTGARQITSVTSTEQGGEVAIRSDGAAILYTPPAGYVGQDRFTYTVDHQLQAVAIVQVQPLARSDSFSFCADPNHGAYNLAVLANDYFNFGYQGASDITQVEVISGSGEAAIDRGTNIRFTPATAGSHQLRYVVDQQYEATVSVWIRNHLDGDHAVVDQNSGATRIDVLANDFDPDPSYVACRSQHYPGARLITAVTDSQQGGTVTVAADGRAVEYTPPDDYFGSDRFTYTVDGFMTQTASIEVIRRVRDDVFRVDAGDGPQTLPVLVNDLFGADYSNVGQITSVTATSAGGEAVVAVDGSAIVYTPPADFAGVDVFSYTVDGALIAEVHVTVNQAASDQLPTFDSLDAYQQFLIDDALVRYQYQFGTTAWDARAEDFGPAVDFTGTSGAPTERSHSETNVQVAGVDEGDIVEFDADFLYMLNDDGVVIVNAWPADQLSEAARVDIEGRPLVEYLHGDRLTVVSEFGGEWIYPPWWEDDVLIDDVALRGDIAIGGFGVPWYFDVTPYETLVTVLDVSDRTAPTVVQTTSMEGRYIDSRGVGDYVYLLVAGDNAVAPPPEIIDDDGDPRTPGRYETQEEYLTRVAANPGVFIEEALPNYTSYGPDGEMVRTGLLNQPEDIYRPIVPGAANLLSVVSLNVETDEPGLADTSAVYSTGASTIYASLENFYVFDADYTSEDGAVTRIVKFDWDPDNGGVEFVATSVVAGSILNQFSADENGDTLRIATTASNSGSGNWTGRDENLLFVLQEDDGVFEFVGSLQNLALNETMRSVRFLGDRAFVTTFRNIDPLFALDLSDPTDPKSVGHVTLPGFTSYMHLVDQNHLLTVGRNTPGGTAGPTQTALFDISDPTQPLRIAEYTFARFSTSEAEIDHHAFGFYAEHGLLGMPVANQRIERVDEDGDGYRETSVWVRDDFLAVFAVDASATDPAARLQLVSQIEHESPARRSGYIGDKLYSVAHDSVKVADVSAPDVIIAELVVGPGDDPIDGGVNPFDPTSSLGDAGRASPSRYPAAMGDQAFWTTVGRARGDLAQTLGLQQAAPMLVTVEAAPAAEGGGYKLVFQVGQQLYAYRSNSDGLAQRVAGDFRFEGDAAAWHSAATVVVAPPTNLPGDYDFDGHARGFDLLLWQRNLGDPDAEAADGNYDGTVDGEDLAVWEAHTGEAAPSIVATPGDFDVDERVAGGDLLAWQRAIGITGPSLADGNRDGAIDGDDLSIWEGQLGSDAAFQAAAVGDFNLDGSILGGDFLNWQQSIGSPGAGQADANHDGRVDHDDLAVWETGFQTPPSAAIAPTAGAAWHDAVADEVDREDLLVDQSYFRSIDQIMDRLAQRLGTTKLK